MEKEIKVLLVDDEADFTDTMSFWLQSKGYSVLVEHDGESAVKTVKEKDPDIIFLDLNMPNMDGEETLKRIRTFDKDLPVIIISAYIDDQKKMAEIRKYGISGVFFKGKDFKEGLVLLEVALRSHKKLK